MPSPPVFVEARSLGLSDPIWDYFFISKDSTKEQFSHGSAKIKCKACGKEMTTTSSRAWDHVEGVSKVGYNTQCPHPILQDKRRIKRQRTSQEEETNVCVTQHDLQCRTKKLNTFSLLYFSIQTQEIDIDIYTTYNMNNFTEIQMSPTQLHH
jgi:hypothetical protein